MADRLRRGWREPNFQAPKAIFDRDDLDIYERMVYLFLCRNASDHEENLPSYAGIARACSMSRRKAIEAVGGLESKGLLSKEIRRNEHGDNDTNVYTILRPRPLRTQHPVVHTVHHRGGVSARAGGAPHAPGSVPSTLPQPGVDVQDQSGGAPGAPGGVAIHNPGSAPHAPGVVHAVHPNEISKNVFLKDQEQQPHPKGAAFHESNDLNHVLSDDGAPGPAGPAAAAALQADKPPEKPSEARRRRELVERWVQEYQDLTGLEDLRSRLLLAAIRKYGEEYVRQKLRALFGAVRQGRVESPLRWLMAALDQDWTEAQSLKRGGAPYKGDVDEWRQVDWSQYFVRNVDKPPPRRRIDWDQVIIRDDPASSGGDNTS